MTRLSERGRAAVAALQADVGSGEERDRMRARLAGLGLAVGAGALSAGVSSAALASSAPVASAAASSVAGSAAASTSTVAAGAPLALGTAAVPGTMGTGALLLAKLASAPVLVKAGALAAVVASASVATLGTPQAPSAPRGPRVESRAATPPAANDVPMRLELPRVAAPPLEVEPAGLPTGRETPALPSAPAQTRPRAASSVAAAAELRASNLGRESALLADALRALRAGDTARAEHLLNEHQHTFGPHALLARERERMREELTHTLR